ncbi:MAG: glycoside hydrolase family 95 protein [Lachnospiraceae bacterium]|nr:glycoside hydrolase family 95 protein [Lachnospiraceae bacterium]
MKELWYRQPAKAWEEALPLGNGRIGAMVFGMMEGERIQVNEETVWYGGKKDRINPDAKAYLPEVRRLICEGKIRAAQDLMGATMTACPASENPYQTLGNVRIYFQHHGVKADEAESPDVARAMIDPAQVNYKRSLSLEDAIACVSYEIGGVNYLREHFISKPADCMIMKFSASEAGKISFTLKLDRWYFFKGVKKTYGAGNLECAGNMEGALGKQDAISTDGKMGTQGAANGVLMYGRPGEDGNAFVMMAKGKGKGGSLKVLGESLIVENADEAILYFGAVTSYRHPEADYDKLEEILCEQLEQVMTRDYEALRAEHVADHRSLFDRVKLDIQGNSAGVGSERIAAGEKAETDWKGANDHVSGKEINDNCVGNGLPIDERLKLVQIGETDLGLEELLFDYGRYLMIAGSRQGTLPTTLQGLWNQEYMPPWESKYTINLNTEMNYWPAEYCNLSECHLPLFEHLKKMRKDGRKVAREMYGCRGFVAHHNTDIHGDCAPQDLWIPATFWPMGAAWLSTHLWTHYIYTKDLAFLKEAFPVMAETALYFVDALQPWGEYFVTNPSSSPENTYILPSGEKGCVCLGPTMDNQILRDLFTNCLKAYAILGGREETAGKAEAAGNAEATGKAETTADKVAETISNLQLDEALEQEILAQIPDCDSLSELMAQIAEKLSKLAPTKIGSDGRVMEWLEEYEEEEPGHRHVSQLYGLYPSEQITMDGTPELAQAARKTLEARLSHGGGHTGWSRAWIMNHYAKLWDGEAAHENIKKMLSQSTYPNMFDKHPPFQIDGNFGAAAAIAQMLVQSNEERVILLPALPKMWKNGSVSGLKLVGNATLSMTWKDGELMSCEITCDGEKYQTMIIYHKNVQMVALTNGEKWSLCQ